jgi:hypothetical protein
MVYQIDPYKEAHTLTNHNPFMKSLLSALVLSAASILPVSAGIHDFSPQNSAPASASAVNGKCFRMADQSHICYQKFNDIFTIAINDVDKPGLAQSVVMNCETGQWTAWGPIPKVTLDWYMDGWCKSFS